jgi:hypothetical protein
MCDLSMRQRWLSTGLSIHHRTPSRCLEMLKTYLWINCKLSNFSWV